VFGDAAVIDFAKQKAGVLFLEKAFPVSWKQSARSKKRAFSQLLHALHIPLRLRHQHSFLEFHMAGFNSLLSLGRCRLPRAF
jgi:hypothetical protein